MEIEFLGTGAGSPAKARNVSSLALKLLDERNAIWLFDCGEGTQHQVLSTTIKPRKIEKIFITHLHGDHLFGLPGLLSSRSFQGGDEPLTIYGPKGIKEYVQTSLRLSESGLTYPLRFVELNGDGIIFDDETFTVSCKRLDHKITSFGYRVVEKDHVGELQVDKLRAADIPSGPVYGQLKAGKTVTLPDGRTFNGQDFIGAAQKGRIVTILGDTRKTRRATELAANADVLVHESTFAADEGKMAHNYYHSTSQQAAEVARDAHAGRLLMNHISARYNGRGARELEQQARQTFKRAKVVRDFDVIDIPFKK
ncbi:ribonuclease Z [Furfurilactobacillus siliginis]|uniref:Ribonuclease Z n=1 Tax=Furfurilactobacillus siliginis TaxID=348151 RepID=A0A0R2L0U2_9LACO|nr:ribonuclease Z [Furfurilactobacillus siliginis]KRN95403.1 ribonuclease Z [Furfurilactobacillus siliginis]GEK28183.1 ribonuclease Z [Furfurilactobacillus siliginis]